MSIIFTLVILLLGFVASVAMRCTHHRSQLARHIPSRTVSVLAIVSILSANVAPIWQVAQARQVEPAPYQVLPETVSEQSDGHLFSPYVKPSAEEEIPKIEEITTTTDAGGFYTFFELEYGTHRVTIDLTTLPPALQPTDAEETPPVMYISPGRSNVSDATSTGVRFTVNYDRRTGNIAGMVFIDANDNGQVDYGEVGLPDVTVIDPTAHQYFVPFNDEDLNRLFQGKVGTSCYGSVSSVANVLKSSIFLTAGVDNTIYYYDHWEDGYDSDAVNPLASSSTEIGVLAAGATKLFDSTIDVSNVGSTSLLYYDGRDRITIVGTGVLVRQAHPRL